MGDEQPSASNAQTQQLIEFWQRTAQEIEQTNDFKTQQLPLARIKKIMKTDEDMIGAEAPILFAKACEIFTLELTLRAWMHTEENKRRTLQRNDIAQAIGKTDTFDFLIDIVPREDFKQGKKYDDSSRNAGGAGMQHITPDLQNYYFQLNHAQMIDPNRMMDPNMQAYAQHTMQHPMQASNMQNQHYRMLMQQLALNNPGAHAQVEMHEQMGHPQGDYEKGHPGYE